MLDQPHGAEILNAVARLLRDEFMLQLPATAAFHARVAANAIDLVAREIQLSGAAEAAARQRLESLLGLQGGTEVLDAELNRRIRQGDYASDDAGLLNHLWQTTLDKMAIDQPGYASYQRAVALGKP